MNGIFARRRRSPSAWYRGARASPSCRIRWWRPARDARYAIDEELALGDDRPMIAKPFSPGNAFPAEEVARERITFDKAMIGSCTNGSYDDLLQAALVICAARAAQGVTKAADGVRRLSGVRRRRRGRSSGPIRGSAASRSPTCSARPAARSGSRGAGRASARARTRSQPGQRAITSFNRNWQNRMGLGGEGYLASPAVVAASALAGLHGAAGRAGLGVGSGAVRHLSQADIGVRRT